MDGRDGRMEEWKQTVVCAQAFYGAVATLRASGKRIWAMDVDASCFLAALLPFASCIAFQSPIHSPQPSTFIVIPALAPLIIGSPSTLSVAETESRAHLLFLLDQPF